MEIVIGIILMVVGWIAGILTEKGSAAAKDAQAILAGKTVKIAVTAKKVAKKTKKGNKGKTKTAKVAK